MSSNPTPATSLKEIFDAFSSTVYVIHIMLPELTIAIAAHEVSELKLMKPLEPNWLDFSDNPWISMKNSEQFTGWSVSISNVTSSPAFTEEISVVIFILPFGD